METNKPKKEVNTNKKPPKQYANLWSIGISNGRKKLYENPEDMQKAVDEYFNWALNNEQRLTSTGLAIYLGFSSRQSIFDYMKLPDFSFLKNAMLLIENDYESDLRTNHVVGSIFALKNFKSSNWADKTESIVTTKNVVLDMSDNDEEKE